MKEEYTIDLVQKAIEVLNELKFVSGMQEEEYWERVGTIQLYLPDNNNAIHELITKWKWELAQTNQQNLITRMK